MKVELTGLGLEIKTKEGTIKLTIDEAKELYRQLHELFGEKVIHVPSAPIVIDRFPTWPVYPPVPIYPRDPYIGDPPFPTWPTNTCQGQTNNA